MRFISQIIHVIKKKQEKEIETEERAVDTHKNPNILSKSLSRNIQSVQSVLVNSADLVLREFSFGKHQDTEIKAALFFIDGMVNMQMINDGIIKPLMHDSQSSHKKGVSDIASLEEVKEKLLVSGEAKAVQTFNDIALGCISGNAILLAEGFDKGLEISVKGWQQRAVTEPTSETSVRGPREGFTENIRTNTSMIRRKIKDPSLKIKASTIGKRTQTLVNLIYIEGLANPDLVHEVESRMSQIDIDAVLATSYLEPYIEDAPVSVFPTIWFSEKPDAVAGKLLEGRVAIAVDGAPFVMSMPMLFIENFQSAEDYIKRSPYSTAMRILRLIAFMISVFMPALYIALSTYQQELIPTTLLFTMAASSEGVPFPVVVEMALMMMIFEILQEAGIRMPRPVGQTISIVGALVMGEAAVRAGLVGAPVVIVIAITAVSSFAVPFAADAVSLTRWFLLIMASVMGTYGITLGGFILLVHLVSIRSFGSPYLAPLAPFQNAGIKDSFVRVPLDDMTKRPQSLKPQDVVRQASPPSK
ncbi:spore germination protein [Scatolibacter rhodanostii]|uniref:spore germination protein n=1 Tax=Scatolibacter rhodanostii TaxID=2014781 RepID=UPI000C0773C6|nr:spore germination protein [Scatolibacter rhodanostii]